METDLLIINSSELLTLKAKRGFKVGRELNDLGIIKNGAVAIKNGLIAEVGPTKVLLKRFKRAKKILDSRGKAVMPGFVDPHTHLVFAGSRATEYEAKISGKSCAEFHRGGNRKSGILYTVEKTRKATKNELLKKALRDLKIMLQNGTTTIEAKSGYGLDVKNEIKILEVIKQLQKRQSVEIIPTFLGAHTVPEEYKKQRGGYVNLVKKLMPAIKKKNLAEFCDVFCDPLGFNAAETEKILEAADDSGFKIKLHADQTAPLNAVKIGAKFQAVSCDHLDFITDKEIDLLVKNKIAGVLLPTVTFHLMEMREKFWPELARKIIQKNVIVALATDYNPGSSPCLVMKTALECASRLYRMKPAEAVSAATINASYAIGRQNSIGSLEKGKKADILILSCPDWRELINTMGVNLVNLTIKNGELV